MAGTSGSITSVPRPALLLGFGGVIPFAAAAVAVWFGDGELAQTAFYAQMIYAAVILSFLGGVHWGLAIAEYGAPRTGDQGLLFRRLAWSIAPPLVAWIAAWFVFSGRELEGLSVLIALTLAVFWGDLAAWRRGLEPIWYLPLRRHLTAAVVICLGSTLLRILTA